MNMIRHSTHLPTPISALQHIFLPFLSPQTSIIHPNLHHPRTLQQQQQQQRQNRTQAQKYPNKNLPSRQQDEQITAPLVQLVSPVDNSLLPPEPPRQILRRLDRTTSILVQVSPDTPITTSETTTTLTLRTTPIVKILSKETLRNKEKLKSRSPPRTPAQITKRLELSWLIDENDLRHKFKQLKTFLAAGRRVEVTVEDRRHKRVSGPEDRKKLLKTLRTFVEGCEGAKEWKEMDDSVQVRGRTLLYFEGEEGVGKEGGEEKKGGEEEEDERRGKGKKGRQERERGKKGRVKREGKRDGEEID